MDSPDCRKCKFRGNVAGSAHSSCEHPKLEGKDNNEFGAMVQMAQGKFLQAAADLNIKADRIGVERGWFMWPANFDPVWLRSCNGFEAKDDRENTATTTVA